MKVTRHDLGNGDYRIGIVLTPAEAELLLNLTGRCGGSGKMNRELIEPLFDNLSENLPEIDLDSLHVHKPEIRGIEDSNPYIFWPKEKA